LLGAIPDTVFGSRSHSYYARHGSKRRGENRPEISIELVPRTHSRHVASEAYRSLRTALLLSRGEGLTTVMVTSPCPMDGKSITASNLAVVMAQLGRSVLVVDADLRKPRQHEIFKVSNRTGLTSYLTKLSDLESIIVHTRIRNLYVVPSGPQAPNPAELLSTERMREFMVLVRRRDFDLVILDTPPMLPVADASLLGAMSDGAVLCLRAGKVLREDAVSCKDRLDLADVKLLGAVLNAYRPQPRYGRGHQPYDEYYAHTIRGESGGSAA